MSNPIDVGEFVTPCCELMYVLYLPVRLAGQSEVTIPKSLQGYQDLVDMAVKHEGSTADGKYIYLTVKSLWVEPNSMGGRMGWHIDGFGTNDINYLWVDSHPTEFCNQEFNLSVDHELSIKQMSEQAKQENITTYPEIHVVRVDSTHVHRVPEIDSSGYRTFARVSISENKYDMIGNAHNHDLDYNWIMHPRGVSRNDTSKN